MTRPALLKLLRWAGTILAGLLTAWFVARLVMSDLGAVRDTLNPSLLLTIGALAVVYASLGTILALGWSRLIVAFGGSREGQMRLHAVTQLMKYLPGNVFHLAGRHGMARRRAVSHETLLLAVLAETGLLVFTSLLVGGLAVPMLPMPSIAICAAAAMGVIATVSLIAALVAWKWEYAASPVQRFWRARWGLARILPLYLTFFAVYGAIGGLLLTALSPAVDGQLFALTAGAFALAWLGGFLAPGAPAGIGVRESVLLLILSPFAGPGAVLFLAALGRVITVLGDALLAAGASLVTSVASGPDKSQPDWETSLGRN